MFSGWASTFPKLTAKICYFFQDEQKQVLDTYSWHRFVSFCHFPNTQTQDFGHVTRPITNMSDPVGGFDYSKASQNTPLGRSLLRTSPSGILGVSRMLGLSDQHRESWEQSLISGQDPFVVTRCWTTPPEFLLFQLWKDITLKWDPAEFGGIDLTRVPSSRIWKPDIMLYNAWVQRQKILTKFFWICRKRRGQLR